MNARALFSAALLSALCIQSHLLYSDTSTNSMPPTEELLFTPITQKQIAEDSRDIETPVNKNTVTTRAVCNGFGGALAKYFAAFKVACAADACITQIASELSDVIYLTAADFAGGFTASTAGIEYRMSEDATFSGATPAMTITAASVIFDMRGFKLTGAVANTASAIVMTATASACKIFNGIILDAFEAGISMLGGALDLTVLDMLIVGDTIATKNGIIAASGTSSVSVSDTMISGMGFSGIALKGTTTATLSSIFVTNCGASGTSGIDAGIAITGPSSAVAISATYTVSNSTDGCLMATSGAGNSCSDSVSMSNTGHGYLIPATASASISTCNAISNTIDGFRITAAAVSAIISECVALTNTGNGFNDLAATTTFLTNLAFKNIIANFALTGFFTLGAGFAFFVRPLCGIDSAKANNIAGN